VGCFCGSGPRAYNKNLNPSRSDSIKIGPRSLHPSRCAIRTYLVRFSKLPLLLFPSDRRGKDGNWFKEEDIDKGAFMSLRVNFTRFMDDLL
jgi:hypothetical protein